MKTGIVIVNYNDAQETINFVKSIQTYACLDTICVVDNGSTDDSLKQLNRMRHKNVTVIGAEQNGGYAKGNNIGLKYLYEQDCEIFIVANSDVIVDERNMTDFIAYMKSYQEYAIFGPAIKEMGTVNRGWKTRTIMSDILSNLVLVNRLFSSLRLYPDRHYQEEVSKVDCVSGCFFGLTKKVIDTIGYLDEGTFLYYEEDILAKKASDKGLKTCVLNNVNIIHNHSVTINKTINHYRKLRILKDSQYYYHKSCYSHNSVSLGLLRATGNIACTVARIRTKKDVANKNTSGKPKVTLLSLHMKVGGIEKAICSLANMLVDTYDVKIINVYDLVDTIPFVLDERIQVEYLSSNLQPNRDAFVRAIKRKDIGRILKQGMKAVSILWKKRKYIKKAAREDDSDIIISTTLAFNRSFAKYQKNKILVAWEHCHPNRGKKYTKKVQKAVRDFTVFIPASKALLEYYKEVITGPKCVYLPLCIDEVPTSKAELGTNQITVMGRLSEEKAYDDMLRVFKEVYKDNPEARLNVIGDGPCRPQLDAIAEDLEVRPYVTFHGNTLGEEKEKLLLDTSVFVTTSHYESFGLVLLEAMSYGIPCVSFSSAEGSLEIIEDGQQGYIIEHRDIIEMALKINKLLRKTTKTMQNNAIKKARQYSYQKVQKQWLEAFSIWINGDIKKRVIFTSSAGGHYSELCELGELMDIYNSFLLTEDHEMMIEYKKRNKATSWYLRPGTKEHLAKFLWNFPFNIVKSFKVYWKVRPDVIIATGAHTTVPICYIAKLFRKKVIFIETFANITTKTLSGKLVYPIADLFLVQWEEMLELYPKAKYKGWLK